MSPATHLAGHDYLLGSEPAEEGTSTATGDRADGDTGVVSTVNDLLPSVEPDVDSITPQRTADRAAAEATTECTDTTTSGHDADFAPAHFGVDVLLGDVARDVGRGGAPLLGRDKRPVDGAHRRHGEVALVLVDHTLAVAANFLFADLNTFDRDLGLVGATAHQLVERLHHRAFDFVLLVETETVVLGAGAVVLLDLLDLLLEAGDPGGVAGIAEATELVQLLHLVFQLQHLAQGDGRHVGIGLHGGHARGRRREGREDGDHQQQHAEDDRTDVDDTELEIGTHEHFPCARSHSGTALRDSPVTSSLGGNQLMSWMPRPVGATWGGWLMNRRADKKY